MRLNSPYRMDDSVIFSAGVYIKRNKEIELFNSVIENRKALIIWGHRRVGKTTFVKHLYLNELNTDEYVCIYIDGSLLCQQIESPLHTLGSFADHINRFNFYEDYVPSIILKYRDLNKIYELKPKTRYTHNEFMNELKSLSKSFANRRIILFIDEMDKILEDSKSKKIAPEFVDFLLSLTTSLNISVVLIGATKIKHTREGVSDVLYSKLKAVPIFKIGNLTHEDSLHLIRVPMEPFTYNEHSEEIIYNITNGQPWLTQDICDTIFKDKVKNSDFAPINKEKILKTIEKLIDPAGVIKTSTHSYFAIMWRYLKLEDEKRKINKNLILSIVAKMKSCSLPISRESIFKYARERGLMFSDHGDIKEDLDYLFHVEILNDETHAIGSEVPLFLDWIDKNETFDKIANEWKVDKKRSDNQSELLTLFGDLWEFVPAGTQDFLIDTLGDYYDYLSEETTATNCRNFVQNSIVALETLLRETFFGKIKAKLPNYTKQIIAEEKSKLPKFRNNALIRYLNGQEIEFTIGNMRKALLSNNKIRELIKSIERPADAECILNDKSLRSSCETPHCLKLYEKIFHKEVSDDEINEFFNLMSNDYWNECFNGGLWILNKIRSILIFHNSNHKVYKNTMVKSKEILYNKNFKFFNKVLSLSRQLDNQEILQIHHLD